MLLLNVCIDGGDCRIALCVVSSHLTVHLFLRQIEYLLYTVLAIFALKSCFPTQFSASVGRHLTVLPSGEHDLLFQTGS